MSNYTGPKIRLSRKFGFALTPKAGRYLDRRPNPPGQHGTSKRRQKQSDFGKQLLEKQKLRLQYNIHERQMTAYMAKATRMLGNTGEILIHLLESRLDAMIFRAGLARSMYAARQYVTHGHISVNGKPVNIPSYQVKVNDTLSIREKSKKMECFQDAIRSSAPPPYLEVSKSNLTVKFLYLPTRDEVPVVCEMPLVIEYYSR
jgi:small subunit ribosomal protein S4